MLNDPLVQILMYFILPLWVLAGFADWACHRATKIETTSGLKESLLHLLQFAEIGVALLAALFLSINAGIIAFVIAVFLLHEATAWWDINYASSARKIVPVEQLVHSFLEIIPLIGIICVSALHWGQFLALFGAGSEQARFTLSLKPEPLPAAYVASLMFAVVVLLVIPFIEETLRCLRARRTM
ncbi:diguanylate cyclase [Candidimonas sp. SYP-B2681]|uniref:diguanylate cyclase n=1 Tax=Candidimonas sp. SYP-B2681 TaxID=2497686 RepID=UPI000F86B2F9|nr:diguanylate cyclase [Candidimonas sp. SYP-B2681]RTZ45579.1 diguanylate cyclase [Candidimonas sp. SYP-B2681]